MKTYLPFLVALAIAAGPKTVVESPFNTLTLTSKEFVVAYDTSARIPRYSAETLTKESVRRHVDRKDHFHPDARVPELWRSTLADWKDSGFDRGHMTPARDMGTPQESEESFALSNMIPQDKTLNRGLWAEVEERSRDLTDFAVKVHVVSGYLLAPSVPQENGISLTHTKSNIQWIGPHHVLVPTHLFKVIYWELKDGTVKAEGYLFPNSPPTKTDIKDYIVPIRLIEHWSGLDFGTRYPKALQDKLEI